MYQDVQKINGKCPENHLPNPMFWKPLESLGESPASLGVAMGAEKRLQTAAWSHPV